MALIKDGYWQDTYWASRYWQEDYWPEYGYVAPLAVVTRGVLPPRRRRRRVLFDDETLQLLEEYLQLKVSRT